MQVTLRFGLTIVVTIISLAMDSSGLKSQTANPTPDWSYYGGDLFFNRYAPLDQIDAHNVSDLEVVWRRPGLDPSYMVGHPSLDPSSYLRSTPIFMDGMLFAPNAVGLVEAFDPASGKTLWVQQPFEKSLDEVRGRSNRGVQIW